MWEARISRGRDLGGEGGRSVVKVMALEGVVTPEVFNFDTVGQHI